MSKRNACAFQYQQDAELVSSSLEKPAAGGASRDRTDDLKLAKLALSQLSYGPIEAVRDGGPRRS